MGEDRLHENKNKGAYERILALLDGDWERIYQEEGLAKHRRLGKN